MCIPKMGQILQIKFWQVSNNRTKQKPSSNNNAQGKKYQNLEVLSQLVLNTVQEVIVSVVKQEKKLMACILKRKM